MSSTSTSSIQKSFKYDVLLSFWGKDTNFVEHLYDALEKSNINTYKGYSRFQKRRNNSYERAIEESKFHIIVLSKNHASSSWCLDEIAKIMECQKTTDQTVFPVFSDVEPVEVGNQSGAFGEAFAKHENEEAAGRWRDALRKAAGLAGWKWKTSANGHEEAQFIHKIVEGILLQPHFINRSVGQDIVGMAIRVKNVVLSLGTNSQDVRMIGIFGRGGGGKTTLARAVFDLISVWFEAKSFVENVREVSNRYGINELQEQILEDVLNDQNIDVTSVYEGKNLMRRMMRSRKALVVLDDVDGMDQLDSLAGEPTWFKPGSRIIITTRDQLLLVTHRVNVIHKVNLLSNQDAMCLFSRYAFNRDIPNQGYEELSSKVVHYAAGLPLTIKVLGSHLCGRSECEWVDAIERLKAIPEDQTLKRLEISYNGLDDDWKEIFLDVVCRLKGEMKNKATRMLEIEGFFAKIGLRVLELRSLITTSGDGRLQLHDLIEEMGKCIVRRMHPDDPGRHNRLWNKAEIEDIFLNELGTEATRSIKLDDNNLHPNIIMNGLRKTRKLRSLYVGDGINHWEIDDVSPYLPDSLQSLQWSYYPFWCLPKTFRANMLVNLEMVGSNISQLWEGGESKILNKLRFLNLSGSKLTRLDLGMTPNLEELNLRKCNDFEELHVSAECRKLNLLILGCPKLTDLNLELIPNLEQLHLEECNDFEELHVSAECRKLNVLILGCPKLINLNLELIPNLEELHLEECNELIELHMPVQPPKLTLSAKEIKHLPQSICMLKHLKFLELESCLVLELLPEDLDRLECLEELHLTNCVSLRDIPSSICKMKCLKYLYLPYCILVKELPEELGHLECLKEINIEGSGERRLQKSIIERKGLHIIGSRGRLESYGFTSLKEISTYTASCYI